MIYSSKMIKRTWLLIAAPVTTEITRDEILHYLNLQVKYNPSGYLLCSRPGHTSSSVPRAYRKTESLLRGLYYFTKNATFGQNSLNFHRRYVNSFLLVKFYLQLAKFISVALYIVLWKMSELRNVKIRIEFTLFSNQNK